ncbi:putative steroid reductase [Aspergillus steynii IBT 23096]|uniref:Putative steroid reductase n=1 Tax=Aspergillus steynii IBT 23096 TaxID=1392250 RepID=A0A2I2FYI6_9EURO|nr:putative steroid reductase [Aspergillus steynii IBT 23096]PLB45699.1 putative steroid reductase [Aspergillus steynii IBT 23096]
MALPLPTIESVKDCASFSHTVLPFLSQLTALPERLQLAATAKDVVILKDIYLSTNPFVSALGLTLVFSAYFLVLSEITRNYSQVDRLWSLLPALFNVHFAVWARLSGLRTQSLDTIAVLSVVWSVRLTYNYWRKGGYKIGSEDYRWEVVRSKVPNRFVFFLFNATFISLVQPLLLLLLTAPTYNFLLLSQLPALKTFELSDLGFSRVAFFFLIIEFFADQQQWHFHCAKHEYQNAARIAGQYKDQFTPEDLERGFAVTGLWSLSRHPNFAAEQAIWLTLYLWNCYRTESFVQWTGIGILGLGLIFQGSVKLTESISASKYPEYTDYQARVGRFIPRLSVKPKYKASSKKKKAPKAEKEQTEQSSAEQEGKKAQ